MIKLIAFEKQKHHSVWDEFARGKNSIFHLSAWIPIIQTAYRFTPKYFFWEQDGSVAGILPGFIVKRPFAGTAYISNPFSVSAGPLAAGEFETSDLSDALLQQLDQDLIDYIELRDHQMAAPGWIQRLDNANFQKDLSHDHEENLLAIPNRQRAVIRKGDKAGLEIDIHHDIGRFLKVYEVSLRNLGTPIYARAYFFALQEHLADHLVIASVRHGSTDVTSVLCFQMGNKLMPYYGGGTPAARDCHGFPWMYWQLMKYGVDRGWNHFDFGRSPKDGGAYQFKKNLGFTPRPMPYSFLNCNGSAPELSQTSPLVNILTNTWQMMPLPFTRLVGPVGSIYAI